MVIKMAQDMFSKWDEAIDTEGLQHDIEEAAKGNGSGDYEAVPHGNYEVSINNMELKASKKGDPMVTIWFKIVEGSHKGSMIFFNQVITKGFQVHIVNELLKKMVEEMDDAPVIEFKTYKQYGQLIMDIFEAVADNFEYALKYAANSKNKDFSTYEITEVFVLED